MLVEAGALLAKALVDGFGVNMEEHADCVPKAGARARKERVQAKEAYLKVLYGTASRPVKKRIERIGATGARLAIMPSYGNRTLLNANEIWYNIALRYDRRPERLQERCNACNKGFFIQHDLQCKKGGLVAIAHDDLHGMVRYLAEKVTTKTHVS